MSVCVSVDCDQCLSLHSILHTFQSPLNESQCWALAYELFTTFDLNFDPKSSLLVTKSEHIFLSINGFVHQKTINAGLHGNQNDRILAQNMENLLSSVGFVLFHALDFGLNDDEERALSEPLEQLIDFLTSFSPNDTKRPTEESVVHQLDEGFDDSSESMTSLTDTSGGHTCGGNKSLDKCLKMCARRLPNCDSKTAESHYRCVCRALVNETLELTQFLSQISKGMKELRRISNNNNNNHNNNEHNSDHKYMTEMKDWARVWIQVIRELRVGIALKKTSESVRHTEYELTPYEMLLNDIRDRKYKLNKTSTNSDVTVNTVKKDAHQLILDFIRSRPPLMPVGRRQRGERESNREKREEKSLYEKLMESIRDIENRERLRPTPCCTPTHSKKEPKVETMSAEEENITNNRPKRRLIKADLNLRLSFDEEMNDRLERNESQSLPFIDNNDKNQRKFSLKNLSLRFAERRHSLSVLETPTKDDTSDRICDLDVNEDTREHVVSIWESHDWGRALECLSLSLSEVKHIRSVLTKAEIESLAVTKALKDDLENGKICFTCLKTRFSFFGARANTCKLCERAICERCATKMHIPLEQFDKVPIYMLSPTPSPPPHDRSHDKWPTTRTAQTSGDVVVNKKSKLMKVLSLKSNKEKSKTNEILVDSQNRKSGPLARVCRDCKTLVRHLIDSGLKSNFAQK